MRDNFDKFFVAAWIFCAAASLALIGFAVWVIVAILRHFGIV